MQDKSAQQLRYESNKEWKEAQNLEHLADEAMKSGDNDRANDYMEAAEELREDSEAKWDQSK